MQASLHQLILKFCSQCNHGSVEILSVLVSPGAGSALLTCCSPAFSLSDLCRRSVPQFSYPCREKLLLILNLNLPRRKDLAHYSCSLPRGCGSNHSVLPASGSLLRSWKLLACLFSAFSSLLKESFWSSLVGYACQTALVLVSVSWSLSSASSRPPWGPWCADCNEKGPPHVLHAAMSFQKLTHLLLWGRSSQFCFSMFLITEKHFGFACLSPKRWAIWICYSILLLGFYDKVTGLCMPKQLCVTNISAIFFHVCAARETKAVLRMGAEQLLSWRTLEKLSPDVGFYCICCLCCSWSMHNSPCFRRWSCIRICRSAVLHSQAASVFLFPVKPTHYRRKPGLVRTAPALIR